MPLLKKERKEYPLWLQNLNHPHQRHAVRLFPGGGRKRKKETKHTQISAAPVQLHLWGKPKTNGPSCPKPKQEHREEKSINKRDTCNCTTHSEQAPSQFGPCKQCNQCNQCKKLVNISVSVNASVYCLVFTGSGNKILQHSLPPPSHCVVTNARLGNQNGHRPYTGDHCGSRTASPSEQHRDTQKRDLPPHPILKSQRPKPRTPRKTPRRADHKRHSEIRSRMQLYKQLRKSLWTDQQPFYFTMSCCVTSSFCLLE